ncbi:hypothetical protein [Helicobacter pylori]|uniref:hypothetical protein n=1 Tax=Helicobacter pylori TaxID=210 RepID=UPI00165B47DC|nr:hypothetical protein [Helicobacter pylori]MBH0249750.1 hypothetical protein [Helicobacter pylori]
MNQNTEQVSQNKGLNEFERAKVYYTKKVADNLLYIANPSNKVEAPYKSDAKLEKMGITKDDYKQSIAQNSRNFCAYSGAPYNNVNDLNLDLEKAIHNYNSSAWIGLSDAAIKLEIGKLAKEEPQKANELKNAHFEKFTNAMLRLEHDKDYPMEKQATSNLVLKDVKDRIFNDIDKNNVFSDEQKSAYKNNIDKLFETINDYCTTKNEKYQQIFFENQKQNQTQKQVDQYSTMEF